MEAMSIETLLLSTWAEDGFVGKTRLPVGKSDIDVLAIHAGEGKVRIGESKVWGESQKVYPFDDYDVAEGDFRRWLTEQHSKWLDNLPRLWGNKGKEKGQPAVPWLLPISQIREIEVVFCCDLHVFCDPKERADESLLKAVQHSLRKNGAVRERLGSHISVHAVVKPTIEVVTDLITAVYKRIDGPPGYSRRFADPFKDLFREIHRYLNPELYRIPLDKSGNKLGTQKEQFHTEIRKHTIRSILKAMQIED